MFLEHCEEYLQFQTNAQFVVILLSHLQQSFSAMLAVECRCFKTFDCFFSLPFTLILLATIMLRRFPFFIPSNQYPVSFQIHLSPMNLCIRQCFVFLKFSHPMMFLFRRPFPHKALMEYNLRIYMASFLFMLCQFLAIANDTPYRFTPLVTHYIYVAVATAVWAAFHRAGSLSLFLTYAYESFYSLSAVYSNSVSF